MPQATFERIEYPADHRGLVIEPIDGDQLQYQRNVHVVLTAPGGIRGNHYHQHSTEISVIIGPALVRVREDGQVRDVLVPHGVAYRFTFPPFVSHAVQNAGLEPLLVMAFNTARFDRANPDVVRDVLI